MNLHQIIAITMFAVIGIKGVRVLSTLYAVELGASPFGMLGNALGLAWVFWISAAFDQVPAFAAGKPVNVLNPEVLTKK